MCFSHNTINVCYVGENKDNEESNITNDVVKHNILCTIGLQQIS